MLVRITKGRELFKGALMWYSEKIGEVFEVIDDPIIENMYRAEAEIAGYKGFSHIYKEDCEVIS